MVLFTFCPPRTSFFRPDKSLSGIEIEYLSKNDLLIQLSSEFHQFVWNNLIYKLQSQRIGNKKLLYFLQLCNKNNFKTLFPKDCKITDAGWNHLKSFRRQFESTKFHHRCRIESSQITHPFESTKPILLQ